MTVSQLIEKLMEFPLDDRVKLGDTDKLWPLEVTKSLIIPNAVWIGEKREPSARTGT